VNTRRTCLFCTEPANSREHVIALCILDRIARPKLKVETGTVDEHGYKAVATLNPHKYVTKQVCRRCNNTWMSQLDGCFIRDLGALIEPKWPTWIDTNIFFSKLRENGLTLARWMIKTAVILDRATPNRGKERVPVAVHEMPKSGVLSPDVYVMIGHIERPDFNAQVMAGFPTLNKGKRYVYQTADDGSSFSFSVQFNHLALRLYRCPTAEPAVLPDVIAKDGTDIAAPFWVYPQTSIYHKHVHHSFPTLLDFNQSVAVKTG